MWPSASSRSTSRSRSESGSCLRAPALLGLGGDSRAPSAGWTYCSPAGDLPRPPRRPRCRPPPSARSRSRPPRTPRARSAGRPASRARAPSRRAPPAARRHALDPARARHDDVHQRRRRASVRDRLEDARRVRRRLADDLDVRPRFEHAAEARPHDGVVVDDQDADRHQVTGTSATTVVPPLDDDSTVSRPPSSATARACRPGRGRPSRVSSASKPCPSSSITAATLSRPRVSRTLTREAARVLDHVRQRLLDDPVERRLDRRRQAARRRASPRSRRGSPVCSVNVVGSRSSAGTSPKSSSAFGRSSTARRRTSCSVVDDLLAQLIRRRPRLVGRLRLLDRLQAEQDRGQRLSGLVVQLARQALALELLRIDDARSASRATRWRGRRRRRHARANVSARRRSSSVNARVRALPVVRDHDPDRLASHDQRHVEARRSRRAVARTPGRPRGRRSASRLARCAVARARAPLFERSAQLACRRSDSAVSPVGRLRSEGRPSLTGSAIRTSRAPMSSRSRRATSWRSRGSSISPESAFPTSFNDSSWRDQRVADS